MEILYNNLYTICEIAPKIYRTDRITIHTMKVIQIRSKPDCALRVTLKNVNKLKINHRIVSLLKKSSLSVQQQIVIPFGIYIETNVTLVYIERTNILY